MSQIDLLRQSGAIFGPSRVHRYLLWRVWDEPLGIVNFVMLNPSTADEAKNDPTVERCEGFARRWGYGGLTVTNLFALRSTDPAALRKHPNPIGPDNDRVLAEYASISEATVVVVAWGNHGGERAHRVVGLLARARPLAPLLCLGVNKTGHPVHPLYQPSDAELVLFPGYGGGS